MERERSKQARTEVQPGAPEVMQKLEQMQQTLLQTFNSGLGEVKQELTDCSGAVKMIAADVKLVKGKLTHLEARVDGQVKLIMSERYNIKSHYYQQRCTTLRFFGLQTSDQGSVHTSAAAPRAVLLPMAERAVRVAIQDTGVRLREDSLCVQDAQYVKGNLQVVVNFSSVYWAQQVMDPIVRDKLKAKGVTYGPDLTHAELANRSLIKNHPKYQAAVKRMPAGARIMWRLDACVLDSRWTAQSEVWTVDSLTVAEHVGIDLTKEA